MDVTSHSEFIFESEKIPIEEVKQVDSSYKIHSYTLQRKKMEKEGIDLAPIEKVLDDFFNKESTIKKAVKKSISKIFYCLEDRIIILLTNMGKEIIWHRNDLIKKYGWFFFVSNKEVKESGPKGKKEKKGKRSRKEIIVKVGEFEFEEKLISIKQKKNMRPLYRTKEYNKYMNIIKTRKIAQMEIMEVLHEFFFHFDGIPLKEKKSIAKIIYYEKERVIVIKSFTGDKMYENLDVLVEKFGWYWYITGVSVGDSQISLAIDKIEKRFSEVHLQHYSLINSDTSLEDITLTLYPISHEPNHNCMILGIGDFKLMLDCGISEEHFEYIKYYLENYPKILSEREIDLKNGKNSRDLVYRIPEQMRPLKTTQESEIEGQAIHEELNEEPPNEEQLNDVQLNEGQSINEGLMLEDNLEDKHEEGVKAEDELENMPMQELDAIFISHSHFDHISGLKDLIKAHPNIPILSSRITLDLYLLRDSGFLKQEDPSYIQEEDYIKVIQNVIYVENGTRIDFKEPDCYLAFFHAGHMPGALMLLVKIKDFRFLYTGDYTYWDITPFAGTRRFLEQISRPIDFLLIDATSAHEKFGDPYSHFNSLILFLEQKAEYGDCTLIGADPSSLAISFMLVFWRYFRKLQLREGFKKRPNIYVDLMVRKNIQVINHRYEYIYGPISRLIKDKANPFNSIKFRWFDLDDLDFLRKKNNIIISHPPDLSYGIIRNIINVIGRNPHNLIFLAGSIQEDPGASLIEGAKEISFSDTWKVPIRALLLNTFAPQLRIKLHGDQEQLIEMIKVLEPKEVCFFHQNPYKLEDAAEKVKEMGVQRVSIPRRRKLMILNYKNSSLDLN